MEIATLRLERELVHVRMKNIRLIARLDVKGSNLIKGIQLEGLRVIGSPNEHAIRYYRQGADELIFMDSVASLYGRNHLSNILQSAAKDIFIPVTAGGGIRSVDDAAEVLQCGADKVAVNTAAVGRPQLITQIARRFGSQCMVLSVEAKQVDPARWEVYVNNGREATGLDVIEWVKQGVQSGAGEVLLTSVDREGTRRGFDVRLVAAVCSAVDVPVIASGGMGKPNDLVPAVFAGADGVAMADALHYNRATVGDFRVEAEKAGLRVRPYENT
jgi:cyclase